MSIWVSSTKEIPDVSLVPSHVAIIMDGNGRWARKRFLPRVAGHKKGLEAVRRTVQSCIQSGISHLTLFAFSSENWRRPADEVSFLMQLFMQALEREVENLHKNKVAFRLVGDRSQFTPRLIELIENAEALTRDNQQLHLTIAANYGGRWDILQAMNQLVLQKMGPYVEDDLAPHLQLANVPEPDLFIRTGGEQRISNFLLWQLAYTELYFTDLLWPDFDKAQLEKAIAWYQARERRFGRTSEQLHDSSQALQA